MFNDIILPPCLVAKETIVSYPAKFVVVAVKTILPCQNRPEKFKMIWYNPFSKSKSFDYFLDPRLNAPFAGGGTPY